MPTPIVVACLAASSAMAVISLVWTVRQTLMVRRTRKALRQMNISMSRQHWYVPE